MALTKQQLEELNEQSFPNNNNGEITAEDLRTFNQELIDNTVNQTVYTTDSSSFDDRINEVSSSHTQVPEGTVSSSAQIDYPLISNIPSGIISSSEQLPSGIVSSSSQVVLEDTTYTDNGDDSFLMTDGAGNLSFQYVKSMYEEIKNRESFEIQRGQALYVDSNTGDRVDVYLADNSNPNRFPATLIASENISPNGNGLGLLAGLIDSIDVGDLEAGDIVYLGTSGGWTNVRPTGSADIQVLGVVSRPGNNGAGYFINQLHTTLPNLPQGEAWVGDSNGVPQSVSTSSWDAHSDLTQLNLFTQSQEIYNSGINSYTQSTDVTIGNIETYVTSSSQRIDLIEDFTSSQEQLNTTFATTGSNTFNGNQTVNGVVTQNFTAPTANNEFAFSNINGSEISGTPYNRVFFGVADFPSLGQNYEDYFGIEYYDSFGYNYGSEFGINGKSFSLINTPSGSAGFSARAAIQVLDLGNGTSTVNVGSFSGDTNLVSTNGKITLTSPLTTISGRQEIEPADTSEDAPATIKLNYPVQGLEGTTGSVSQFFNQFDEEVDPGVFLTLNEYRKEHNGFDSVQYNSNTSLEFNSTYGLQFSSGEAVILRAGQDGTNPILLGGAPVIDGNTDILGTNTQPARTFEVFDGAGTRVIGVANPSGSAVLGGRVIETNGQWYHDGKVSLNSPNDLSLQSPGAGLNMSGDFGDGTRGLKFQGEGSNGGVIEFGMFNSDNPFGPPAGTISFGNFIDIGPPIGSPLTETVKFRAENIEFTGSIDVSETIRLTPLDPLPSGQLGELAVSGSDLYFHNGTNWVVK